MKPVTQLIAALTLAASAWTGASADERIEAPRDKTLSPYFYVQGGGPEADRLPLKSTSAVVNIAGVIADVKVIQVYKNEGNSPLEAIYVFPASTRAAVYGMKMTIGERVIIAKIDKKDDARRVYEQAKQQGRSASLLEQQRPNVFQMNVANIMPADLIKVELSYTELLIPRDKTYEFTYPTVVGPRYANTPSGAATDSGTWVETPYHHQGDAPAYDFDISVNLVAGLPLQNVVCASHHVYVDYHGPAHATISLDQSEERAGNRDYVLKYRLAGDQVESGLLLYQGKQENFFLLMMQPPSRISVDRMPGREYIFIVDVSGSMFGFPLDISKKLLKDLIGNLRPSDRFNVLLFSGGSTLMAERSVSATPENVKTALDVIDHQHGGGGTELLPALKRSLALPGLEGFSRTVVIVTDGYVTVEEEAFDLIKNYLGKANMFAFGIGSSVNRHIIEGMAHVGMGEPFVITKPEEARTQAERFRKLIQYPVLTGIKTEFNGFDVYDVDPPAVPDLLADRPVILFGKWRGRPAGEIRLQGLSGDSPYSAAIDVSRVKPLQANAALPYLWARHRIMLLSDYNLLRLDDGRVKEVAKLGLDYNLLTAYTSFVAADTEARNKDGGLTTIKQPLPLPEGVSDYAVGASARAAAPAQMPLTQGFAAKEEKYHLRDSPSGAVELEKKQHRPFAIKDLAVSGGLTKETVLSVIQQHIRAVLDNDPKGAAQGTLVMSLTIQGDGTIKTVAISSRELKNKDREQRVLKAAKKWRFPVQEKNKETTVTLTVQVG